MSRRNDCELRWSRDCAHEQRYFDRYAIVSMCRECAQLWTGGVVLPELHPAIVRLPWPCLPRPSRYRQRSPRTPP